MRATDEHKEDLIDDPEYDEAFDECMADPSAWVAYCYNVAGRLGDPHMPHHLFGMAVELLSRCDEENDMETLRRLDAMVELFVRRVADQNGRTSDLGGRVFGPNAPDLASPSRYFKTRAREILVERGAA